MDSRITIGDKLDLKKIEKRLSADPDREPAIYVSQVLDETDAGDILVAMPISEGKVIPLSVDEEFDATFYTKSGLLSCRTIVSGRYKKGALFLLALEQQTELKKMQRREYFRLNCRMPITYRVLDGDEAYNLKHGLPMTTTIDEDSWKNGIMIDLSGGGIRFVSAFKEEHDMMLQVRFDIVNNNEAQVVYAFATLLRSEKSPNNPSIYDQRIKFFKMDRNLREAIIRFIFETQRKNRSKETGME